MGWERFTLSKFITKKSVNEVQETRFHEGSSNYTNSVCHALQDMCPVDILFYTILYYRSMYIGTLAGYYEKAPPFL
jgi:hypothetical protein